jgi:serine/threonine-protein kinase
VNAAAEISQENFLALVLESRLVTADALDAALDDAPVSDRAKHLARHLVKKGLLTRFQAQQILSGRSAGFYLGQYRVLELVGQGGMGKVYKAEHMTMSRVVALKVLSYEVTRTERARQLFRREVRAAARLAHPYIATAYDANEVNGRAFLVLEYVAGPNLSRLVRENGPLPVGQACEFIRQASLGLQHAHALGMVHRDIKPSNLLVQPPLGQDSPDGGTIKLVDFGLALLPAADDADDAVAGDRHAVLGTPDYLSPEQGRDIRAVDIRSDLYSLGCTLYFLLAGRVPFPGGSAIEKLSRHANEQPHPIEQLRPAMPASVSAIVRRLMAKSPADRFQDPQALADALAPFAEAHPLTWPRAPHGPAADPGDDPPGSEDPSDLGTGSAGVAMSGTVSMAEFASTLPAHGQSFAPDFEPVDDHPLRTRFIVAVLTGFLLGAALIVAATLMR